MELPNPIDVRRNFIEIEKYFEQFVNFLSNQDSLDFKEFLDNKHFINMKMIRLWGQISYLTLIDKKYSKASEEIRKILLRLVKDLDQIEKKHLGRNLIFWDSIYKEGKLRKDLIKFFKDISKQMKKIEKNV